MNMNVKQAIKSIYMHVRYPVIYMKSGHIGKCCFIGRRARVNKLRYLNMGNNCRLGNDCRISFFDTFFGERYSPSLEFGDNVYIGDHITVLCADRIVIEDNVLMASHITITSENHGINPEAEACYAKQPLITKEVHIGAGVWIGEKAIILPGVDIGEKAIIAAGAVVTKSVPAFSIAAGNPARVIKKYNFTSGEWEKVIYEK